MEVSPSVSMSVKSPSPPFYVGFWVIDFFPTSGHSYARRLLMPVFMLIDTGAPDGLLRDTI